MIVWDGGNNDLPFFRARPAHRRRRPAPGRARAALPPRRDEPAHGRRRGRQQGGQRRRPPSSACSRTSRPLNPAATVVRAASPVTLDDGPPIAGRCVLCVEDGPTVTHGGMPFGAAAVAAGSEGARIRVDPRPTAVGSIAEVYDDYPHIGAVLPAMGYGDEQLADLEATINATDCDVVVTGTPIDLGRLIDSPPPDPPRPLRARGDRAADDRRRARSPVGRPPWSSPKSCACHSAKPAVTIRAVADAPRSPRGTEAVTTATPRIGSREARRARRRARRAAPALAGIHHPELIAFPPRRYSQLDMLPAVERGRALAAPSADAYMRRVARTREIVARHPRWRGILHPERIFFPEPQAEVDPVLVYRAAVRRASGRAQVEELYSGSARSADAIDRRSWPWAASPGSDADSPPLVDGCRGPGRGLRAIRGARQPDSQASTPTRPSSRALTRLVASLDVDRLEHDALRLRLRSGRCEAPSRPSAPSATLPRAASSKCSRKCASVKCESAPRRTRIRVTRRAPAAAASRLDLPHQVLHQLACSCTARPPLERPAATCSTAASTSGDSSSPASKLPALDPVDDRPGGSRPSARASSTASARPSVVRRGAEELGRQRLLARVEPVHRARRRRPTTTASTSQTRVGAVPARRSAPVGSPSRSSTSTPGGSVPRSRRADREAGGVVAAPRRCRRRSTFSSARPRASGSASRRRCRGRSCGSSARRASGSSSSRQVERALDDAAQVLLDRRAGSARSAARSSRRGSCPSSSIS